MIRKVVPTQFRRRVWRWREQRRMLDRLAPERRPVCSTPHGLPGELIVSVTSYGRRFGTLHLTLESLLNQTIKPDRVVLWLGHGDVPKLPRKVRALMKRGLEVRGVTDLRQYTKLVFALSAFPDGYIVTADDDIFYRPDWLASLVAGYRTNDVVVCRRAHRLVSPRPDIILPYLDWQWDVQDAASRTPSTDILPTGVGGVLYPPGVLHPDVTNETLFLELAPTNDDLWFFWMARRAGSRCEKVGGEFEMEMWPDTQEVSLYQENVAALGNDRQVAALLRRYGNPLSFD